MASDAMGLPNVASSNSKPLRAMIVDGDLTQALAIEKEFSAAGLSLTIATNLGAARARLRDVTFDVVIVEIVLPDGRGESLLPDVEACPRQPAVVIVSACLSQLQVSALEYRPAVLSKPLSPARLLQFVRTLARGYSRSATDRFVSRFRLTRREAEATILISRGLRAKSVADQMGCSEKTVYAHLMRVCEKTGCHDYREVVGKLLSFTCHELGHTPPDHPALCDVSLGGTTAVPIRAFLRFHSRSLPVNSHHGPRRCPGVE